MTNPRISRIPVPTTALPSGARQVLFGTFAGHLFEATRRQHSSRVLRVGTVPIRNPVAGGGVLTADLVVETGGGDALPTIAAPLVIVEILGVATEEAVRRAKLPVFRAQPLCREIVLIQEHRLYCEVHRRLSGERWITDLLLDRDARLRLETAGLDLPLGALYAQTGLNRC